MKYLFILFCVAFSTSCFSQKQENEKKEKQKLEFDKTKPVYTLDASCGTCQFHMKGTGCNLAVKFEDKYYYVSGTSIDDHGDAHEKDGFCNAIRKAKVQGTVVNDSFAVTYFKLIKE